MEFRILGPVEIRVNGQRIDAGHARQRAVLAVLLLDLGRVVSAEQLIDRVWGDGPPASVRNLLYGYVGKLRAAMAGAQESGVTLARRAEGYLLEASRDQVDLYRFRRQVGEAAATGGDDERTAVLLRGALGLWHGPALAGLDSPWLSGVRDSLELRRVAAVRDLSDIALRQGRHDTLIGELTEAAAVYPADERLIGQLMLALYRSGRQGEALRWFEQTRRWLAGELGADPGPGLRALHQRILRGDSSLAAPGPAGPWTGPAPRPRQPHQQVGTAGPAAILQEPAAAAAGSAHLAVPRELPAQVPHFTGRAEELETLTALLGGSGGQGPEAIVVSAIGGTAGVGKTALAVRWAHQVAERFPDGQLYVNLRGYDPDQPVSAADALATFLRSLGVAGQDIPPGQDERAARYRSLLAGKRALVVLDNAGSAEQVRPLLPGSAACVVVVTSRDTLAGLVARDGARRLDLDLLPLEDAVRLLRVLIGGRADADPDAATALAVCCCRLPLAMRVAAEVIAARPAAPLADLVAEMGDQQRRLDLLEAGGDLRAAVRAVFSWSYRHLDTAAAAMFRQLGLYPGPDFDGFAAAALAGTPVGHASEALSALARAHLIQHARAGRYSMHDLLRAYASELGSAEDTEPERQEGLTRLLDYYLGTAAAAMDSLYPAERDRRPRISRPATPAPPVTDPAAARGWLDGERAALVAVVAHAAEHGPPGYPDQLAETLFRYLEIGSHYPDAITIYTHVHTAARQSGDHEAEATALNALGVLDWQQGRNQQAMDKFQQALALFQLVGNHPREARMLNNLGLINANHGNYQQAITFCESALTAFRRIGDRLGEGLTLGSLGFTEERLGRYDRATHHLQQALTIAREAGNRNGECTALSNLGNVDMKQERYEQASRRLNRALALCRETGYRAHEADALRNIGDLRLRQGRLQEAASHMHHSLSLYQEIGNQQGEAEALNSLGDVLRATGQPGMASSRHASALRLATESGDRYQQAHAYDGLGHACRSAGDIGQACDNWRDALALYTELGVPEAGQVNDQLVAAATASR